MYRLCPHGYLRTAGSSQGQCPSCFPQESWWTAEQDRQLQQLRDQGMTARQISNKIHRTVAAIECRLLRLRKAVPP